MFLVFAVPEYEEDTLNLKRASSIFFVASMVALILSIIAWFAIFRPLTRKRAEIVRNREKAAKDNVSNYPIEDSAAAKNE